jgi:hypothetical protein
MKRVVLITIVAAGCMPEAPARPSFQLDVAPILAANCVRCHGYPVIGGGPASMRLDSYSDVVVEEGLLFAGAATYASAILSRITNESSELGPMPPRFPLDDYQIDTLANWVNQVPLGERPPRGAGRPGNRVPTVEILRVERAGALHSIAVRVDDADRDLVAGELRLHINDSERIVGGVQSGNVVVHWDTTGLAAGTYPLAAYLDDGADVHVIPLGMIEVAP